MNPLIIKFLNSIETKLEACEDKNEALHIFCSEVNDFLFANQKIEIRLFTKDQSFYCEKGRKTKPFLVIPFDYDNRKIFLEFSSEKPYSVEPYIITSLMDLIERHFGGVDKKLLDKYARKYKVYKEQQKNDTDKLKPQSVIFSNSNDKDVLFKLMPFKVKDILLIASLYDAFSIESEGNLTQKILGEFLKLNLTTFPKVTAVTTYREAYDMLKTKHFDLIIVMVGSNKRKSSKIIDYLKEDFPYLPVYLLLNSNADVSDFIHYKLNHTVDNLFIWNGDSRIFFSMIKLLEDKINLKNDVKIARSRFILLVEDTPRFYSRYLPELYMIIFKQARKVLEETYETDELYKLLSIRLRPKVILTSTYEEAIAIYNENRDSFLSLITDVEFYRNGKKDKNAGIDLATYIKSETSGVDIPIIIQSHDIANKERADKLNCAFIYKDSDSLVYDIQHVFKFNMGFGDFIYRDEQGNELGYRAKNLDDFEKYLTIIPDKSLMYHALRNHFSIWLMARGQIKLADFLSLLRSEDFRDANHLRSFLVNNVKTLRLERIRGKVIEFTPKDLPNNTTVVTLSSGALGGKARGLVFINKLVYGYNFKEKFEDLSIEIKTPSTYIIGTDSYDEFIEANDLHKVIFDIQMPYEELKKRFLESKLDDELVKKLRELLKICTKPIAVRSSGLLEDSITQPFAGVYETYIIPNNSADIEIRLKQLQDAIKLVYASVFSPMARDYIKSIDYKIEEEKMAVVLQEVIGRKFGDYYYPHISGTAQSYNYYPFSYLKPDDGLAAIALGLGIYVVSGGQVYHFSPKYPKVQNYSLKELVNNSQTYFYAVDMKNENFDLLKGEEAALKKLDLWDAEKHGTLKHLASVYDAQNNILRPGIDYPGPRVLNFANILQFNYIPLAETLARMLKIGKNAMGAPVEIEFAIDLEKDKEGVAKFYILQIKPLIANAQEYEINLSKLDKKKLLFFTDNSMGNGVFKEITDVVYVVPEKFNKSKTEEIAKTFEKLNRQFRDQQKHYVLISPGRLGTQDRWIGVPVVWSQISNAKVIIETSLPNFPLDASAGSHFFHNVVAMNVGYFSVQYSNPNHILRWDVLEKQKIIYEDDYVRHVRFDNPLIIRMDGRKRIAIIELRE